MKLIVGLGNPGEKYKNVRHNLGFEVVDQYVSSIKYQVLWEDNKKLKSQVAKIDQLVLAKPQTYMNNSGLAVKLLTSYYKIPSSDVIVLHDELDLPLGKIKVGFGGAAAGHHGVESVIDALGTDNFVRIRLGIGNEKSHNGEHTRISFTAEEFVLDHFSQSEKLMVNQMIKQAVKAIEIVLNQGVKAAQNQFN